MPLSGNPPAALVSPNQTGFLYKLMKLDGDVTKNVSFLTIYLVKKSWEI
jgi:hypothetical protein